MNEKRSYFFPFLKKCLYLHAKNVREQNIYIINNIKNQNAKQRNCKSNRSASDARRLAWVLT